jgi:adenylate cyclase
MNEERARRKLSGILCADAVGYSRLMRLDEAATVATLKEHKEIMALLIDKYRGRVVDSPGDNILAEFGSVVDAVECAVEIQNELKNKNDGLPNDRKMEFRIGVHLGDVLEEETRIYGDGVNIAARIEGLAPPIGICISRTAYDQVKNKLNFGYEYLGEQTVKNIDEPVRVYRVLTEPEAAGKVIGEKKFLGRFSRKTAMAAIIGLVIVAGGLTGWNIYLQKSIKVEPASLDKMAYPLPEKPSIAVLPFDNLSGNPEQDYISNGFSENIITALSKIPEMFVIAQNTSFSYKGKPIKISQVSEDLGVQYVLDGSVQKTGTQLRVTAQLIDALSGHHLWAERYDRDLSDLFVIQDKITLNILQTLQVRLTSGETARLSKRGVQDLEAYIKVSQATEYLRRWNKEANAQARQLAQEAIELEPKYPSAYKILAWTHMFDAYLGWSKSPKESMAEAFKLTQKALALDDSDPSLHSLLGQIYIRKRGWEKAIAEFERSIELGPNLANPYAHYSRALHFMGKYKESTELIKTALRLDPIPPNWFFLNLGSNYQLMGKHLEAIKEFKKVLSHNPNDLITNIRLTATYGLLGREEDAHAAAAEVLRLNPKFSVDHIVKTWPYKNQTDLNLLINGLRKAGLK